MENYFDNQTEALLVKFGRYILSRYRDNTIQSEDNKRLIHDADIANFKYLLETNELELLTERIY